MRLEKINSRHEERNRLIRERRAAGATLSQIASEFGLSGGYVGELCKRAVLAPSRENQHSDHPPYGLYGKRFRLSLDEPNAGVLPGLTYLAPPDSEQQWRRLKLDSKTLDRIDTATLLELLADLSPEISLALWQFNRFCNPGFEVKAMSPGSEKVNTRAQAAVDDFLKLLGDLYGSIDVVIARLFVNAFMRGGFFAELVLNNAGREPIDLATPDSRWLFFKRVIDPERGTVWVPYQWQGSQQVPMDRPTIRYVPIDPLPGKPNGRALAWPALHATLFTLGLMHDLRRVIAQQGWPRLDIKIQLEQLLKTMPADLQGDPEKMRVWLNEVVDGVGAAYAKLEPDDAYVHTDVTEIGGPHGTVDSQSLGEVDGIIDVLERMISRGLKSNALLMGIPEGMSEASANRLYEWHIQGIKAIQHLCEGLLEYLLQIALQVQGIQAIVPWRFAENRAAEMLRDAQVQKLNLGNAALAYALGYVSQDEAATMALGKDKADQEVPRIPTAGIGGGGQGGSQNPDVVNPEPGSTKTLLVTSPAGSWTATSGNGGHDD
jgi:hypothetical protein